MKIYQYPDKSTWAKILKRPTLEVKNLEPIVADVLEEVRTMGDAAVIKYGEMFDKVAIKRLEVSKIEIAEAKKAVPEALKAAIKTAMNNVKKFHTAQKEKPKIIETTKGVQCWRKSIAIQRVGLYIPGGTAPLFSTVLMLGVPAKIAGCNEIVLCTPPQKDGKINPVILFTANLVGITRIFKIGGVQAIGAMAYGTQSVPSVYKIFGPGNQYVTCAKQMVNQKGVAIDMPAGPSEVLVVADASAKPAFIAADLLSQAEHGADSQVVFITFDEKIAEKVQIELQKQLKTLPRMEYAEKALLNSSVIIVHTEQDAVDIINEYAPEHLIIQTDHPERIADRIVNAGSIFLGHYSPESVGDYASGTNHTLPTNGYATAYSGVSLDSFVKKITFQKLTQEGLNNIGNTVALMAEAEQLLAHKMAVTLRMK